ncbi:MAG: hypothetical protein WCJ30_00440 [Deltaproteobacteria bacterium]
MDRQPGEAQHRERVLREALLTGWLEFFAAGLATQLQEVRAKGEQAIRADVLASEKSLNARQTILVGALLERGSLTLADAERLLPDVARRTVQRDLKRLTELGLVTEVGREARPTRTARTAGASRGCDDL